MAPLPRTAVPSAKNPFSSEFNLDAFSKTHQYIIITSVLFFFTLLYGYLQELVAIHLFARQYGIFLTLVQFMGYTAFAAVRRFVLVPSAAPPPASAMSSVGAVGVVLGNNGSGGGGSAGLHASGDGGGTGAWSALPPPSPWWSPWSSSPMWWPMSSLARRHTIPLSYCVGLAVSQAMMQSLSNLAMRYLNYPAKVMFKSCRVIPTMLYGVLVYKKKYSRREWVAMTTLVLGLVAFTQADIHSGPAMNPLGILLISASLVLDAGILNVQDHCFTSFKADEDEVVFMSYAGGSVLLLVLCVANGELTAALGFVNESLGGATGVAAVSLACFSACGYFGVMCVVALTHRFGPLVAALTTTARKALTVGLSFVLFPKPVTPGHFGGAFLFVVGIALKATAPRSSSSSTATATGTLSPSPPSSPFDSSDGTTTTTAASADDVSTKRQPSLHHQHHQQRWFGEGTSATTRSSNGSGGGSCGGGSCSDGSSSGGLESEEDVENGGSRSGGSGGSGLSSMAGVRKSRTSPKAVPHHPNASLS